ncbi:MAG: hypothetical protein GYB31_04210, partial [Bacteroidetes bacterium]|nr:hypothetical protein [Bacteroidota bacterium]
MNRPYCLIGLLLLLLPILTQAQQQNSAPVSHFPFRIYTAKDGLSQTLVHQIVQDTFGYIWTGGREGINRFDGLNFINHRIDSTYPDDVIRFSYFFPPNQIWMAGNNGIYSINKDSISNYLPESGEMLNHASSIFLSHRNSVCVKQKKENSYSILEFKDGEFSRASDLEKLLDNYYKWKYIPDEGGYLGVEANFSDTLNYFSLYFTSTDGKRILIQSGTFPRQFPPPTVLVKKGNTYVKINHTIYKFQNKKLTRPITIGEGFKHFEVRNEEFIFHNDSAVFKWNGEKIIDYGLRLPAIYQIFLDREERLWISCETGLVKVTSEAIRVYPQNRGCPPNVWTVLEDNNAVFWLGTFRNGVHTYSPQTNRYQNRPLITSYLNENTPYYFDHFYPGALMDSTGNLIFPTASRVISISNGIPKILDLPYLGSSACQGLKERDGEFLVATKGFIRVKKDGSKEFYGQKDGLNMNRLSYFETIERDTQGHYWLGSHNGLVFADLEKKSFKHYYVGKDIHAGINTIAQTPDHRLWFG